MWSEIFLKIKEELDNVKKKFLQCLERILPAEDYCDKLEFEVTNESTAEEAIM